MKKSFFVKLGWLLWRVYVCNTMRSSNLKSGSDLLQKNFIENLLNEKSIFRKVPTLFIKLVRHLGGVPLVMRRGQSIWYLTAESILTGWAPCRLRYSFTTVKASHRWAVRWPDLNIYFKIDRIITGLSNNEIHIHLNSFTCLIVMLVR